MKLIHIKIVLKYKKQVQDEKLPVIVGIEVAKKGAEYVYGTNTLRDGYSPISLKNKGEIVVYLNNISLLEGTYSIGVAFADKSESINYDFYHEIANINVYSEGNDIGITRITHSFFVDGEDIR